MGVNDPRARRSAQGLMGDALLVAPPLLIDNDGRITLDPAFVQSMVSVWKRVAVAADYRASANDQIIGVTSTASARTVTLPSASGIPGRMIVVKDESGACSSHNITIATVASQTIDGSSTFVMSNDYESILLYSDGKNWMVS